MPELMINPVAAQPQPTASVAGTGAQATGAGAAEPTAGTSPDAPQAPFAAVLKSRMKENGSTADDAAAHAGAAVRSLTPTAESPLSGLDLTALFALVAEAAQSAATPAEQAEAGESGSGNIPADVASAGAVAPAPTPTALPATMMLATADTTPTTAPAVAVDARAAATLAPDAAQPHALARVDTATTAPSDKPAVTGLAAGNLKPETAIPADPAGDAGKPTPTDAQSGDFRALMERSAAAASAAQAPAGTPASATRLRVDTPVGQAGWHDEMGQKLTWMVGNNRQQAELVLNPPQLGRIEVSLTMSGDQASAVFTSPNPAVREALENSLHRLREVLADAGVALGQAQVGSESPNRSREGEPDFGGNDGVRYASARAVPESSALTTAGAGRGLVDVFA